MSYRGTTVARFLEELSSGAATPGGGCAAALSGALAAGLVAMVARNTGGLDEIVAEADGLRCELEELVDADAAAFGAVMAAFRLPKETVEQKTERSAAIQAGYKAAVEAPLLVCRRALRVLELAGSVAELGNPNAISDVGVAALLAASALEGAALNVEINLGSIKDEIYRAEAGSAVQSARDEGGKLRDAALERVVEALR
ncbi:MAG TPA: cyclodeaminase/cyclohydrolase family protein [Gaiellaceae bacterium]|nr:cyclodeaminase/cyclohydrolase family protein [Gaiellaceae bacterium]